MQTIDTIQPKDNKVNLRNLYLFLGLKSENWRAWYPTYTTNNKSIQEGIDYTPFTETVKNKAIQNFYITIDYAKALCLQSNNIKGKKALKYFNEYIKQQNDHILQNSNDEHTNMWRDLYINNTITLGGVVNELKAIKELLKELSDKLTSTNTNLHTNKEVSCNDLEKSKKLDINSLIKHLYSHIGGMSKAHNIGKEEYYKKTKKPLPKYIYEFSPKQKEDYLKFLLSEYKKTQRPVS